MKHLEHPEARFQPLVSALRGCARLSLAAKVFEELTPALARAEWVIKSLQRKYVRRESAVAGQCASGEL